MKEIKINVPDDLFDEIICDIELKLKAYKEVRKSAKIKIGKPSVRKAIHRYVPVTIYDDIQTEIDRMIYVEQLKIKSK